MMAIISFLIVFSVIVISHEFGHFIFSRLAGIKVLELGLGLGPRIAKFVANGILYTVNVLPLGGFIKIAGINPESETKDDKYRPEESYVNKTPFQKFLTILGGPFANIFAAFIIFILIFSIFGIPSGVSNEISRISPMSEAENIGLLPGDRIVEVNGAAVINMEDTVKLIHQSAGKTLMLKIDRKGDMTVRSAVPKYDAKLKAGLIGFSLKPTYKRIGVLRSVQESAKQVAALTVFFIYMLGMLITGRVSLGDVAGPVGIAQFTGQVAGEGIIALLGFTAFLSINLGVINLLPIPALDGGRIVFILIEAVRKKPVNIEVENRIHYYGLMLLLALFFIVTVNDIMRIVGR